MPKFVGKCNDRGQLIADVIITQGELQKRHLSDAHSFRALIDTGATKSTISSEIVSSLKLIPCGKGRIKSATESRSLNIYDVCISIPKAEIREIEKGRYQPELFTRTFSVQATELPKQDPDFDVLLGMDILGECLLVVEGSHYILAF